MQRGCYNWPWKPMDTIPVDNELNSLLRLNPEFPLAVSHDNLSSYKNSFVNWHKQGFIELSVVTENMVTVNLLNHQERIETGEGFLILPGILHSIRSSETECPAKYQTVLFDPCMLTGFRGSYFEKNYYKPEIINRNGFFHFSMDCESLFLLADDFHDIFQDIYWEDVFLKNQILQKLQKIWIALWDNVIVFQANKAFQLDDARLWKMIDFLQTNFQKKFVLDDLCDYVNLSRSACCRYFRRMMNMSISEYILEYRLSQAIFLLDNTDGSITEVALQTGFSTTSYFISIFKKKMLLTPYEYKIRNKEKI